MRYHFQTRAEANKQRDMAQTVQHIANANMLVYLFTKKADICKAYKDEHLYMLEEHTTRVRAFDFTKPDKFRKEMV